MAIPTLERQDEDGQAIDLFLDTLMDASLKDERCTMEFPFFSIQKTPQRHPVEYSNGSVRVRIEPGQRGMATIWDKDVLIYCASLLNEKLERGAPVSRTLSIPAYDLLKVCRRGTGKAGYQRLYDALVRLRSTTILTNICADGELDDRGFGWIDDFHVVRGRNGVMKALEITLSRWVFNAVVKDRRVLTIHRDYFGLTMGLERRLYELARKHCGRQPKWPISLDKLAAKCGSVRDLRKFKAEIKRIALAGTLPEYDLAIAFDPAMRRDISSTFGKEAGGRYRLNSRAIAVFTPRGRIGQPDHLQEVSGCG